MIRTVRVIAVSLVFFLGIGLGSQMLNATEICDKSKFSGIAAALSEFPVEVISTDVSNLHCLLEKLLEDWRNLVACKVLTEEQVRFAWDECDDYEQGELSGDSMGSFQANFLTIILTIKYKAGYKVVSATTDFIILQYRDIT